MKPRVIHTEADHEAALQRVGALMENDPDPTSPEGEELELWSLLVERYEQEKYPMDLPTPLAAIQFRMEQQGLRPKDLVQYLGSPSKVSEILNGKRPLTLAMIRRLHDGLGIPAEVLIGEKCAAPAVEVPVEKFPVKTMYERGWFDWFTGNWNQAREQAEELLLRFFNNHLDLQAIPALHRQNVRSGSKEDLFALHAWKTRVIRVATARQIKTPFEAAAINEKFVSNLRALSLHADGPKLAVSLLEQYGIPVVIESHLQGTHLDGAALRMAGGAPAMALTLRHDRLDNFWFCLFHELAHVIKHLCGDETDAFFDNLEAKGDGAETEADQFALDGLIPPMEWAKIRKAKLTAKTVVEEARRLVVHPAVIAGRIRREKQDYSKFSQLVGQGQVRVLFPEWRN
ncbi:MAG: plasmid stabilization protein [Pedosphaera sp.]|nr:plasmid stabilization protein [Pedosphaera sp.]